MAITTALGADALVLNRFTARERISGLFEIEADLASEDGAADFSQVVGHNATIRLELGEKGTRYFNGYVSRLRQMGHHQRYARYRATLVPWFWFLTRTADCRVFQRKSTLEIAEEIFNGSRFGSEFWSPRTSESYQKRRYCVQYRETDFNFVSRLLESEGIYYWFDHSNGRHRLVLADRLGASQPAPGYATLEYQELVQGPAIEREVITEWSLEKAVQPAQYDLKDFDFKKPSDPLKGKHEISRPHGMARFPVYDYPGEYFEAGEADRHARLRLEELQAQHEVLHGSTSAMGLAAGGVFELQKHPRSDQNRKYLITELTLTADAGEFASGGSGEEFYVCSFTAIPSTTPFRAARVTPKPVVQGVQTATVVGPKGEEIHTDKYGRVKVQFHWDRYGKADEDSSCWVRVSQDWAGKKWGALYLPRIGQEVIVEFLEGDPDRPIITGRVYNAEAMPPYDLPAEKTKSTLKSNSSKGGQGFNEIRFEDNKGKEQIFVHAEKNEDIRVKNDALEWIGNERHLIVKKDQLEKVEGDKHSKVKGDRLSKTEGDVGDTIKGGHLVAIDGDAQRKVKGKQSEKIDGDVSLKVGMNLNTEAGQKISIKSGMDFHGKAGMNYAMDAGMAVHIKGGMTVVIEAGMQLSLKVGGNFVDINPGGVFITGTMVMINSGGAAGSGSGSSPTAPAAPEAPDPPKDAKEADDAKSGEKTEAKASAPPQNNAATPDSVKVGDYSPPPPPPPAPPSPAAQVLTQAAQDGTPFCEQCERAKQGGGG